jgi:hypothetical protein
MSLGQFLDDLVDLTAGTTAVFTPVTAVDKNNQPSAYGAPTTYAVQVGGPVKYMHRLSAQEKVSSQTLYIFTPNSISAKDIITMPSGYEGTTTPKIAQVDRKSDELGFCYTVVYLG